MILPAVAGVLDPQTRGAGTGRDAPGAWSVLVALVLTLARSWPSWPSCWSSGSGLIPWLLEYVARTGSRELFTARACSPSRWAWPSAPPRLFGVSFALGAFFAGMMLRESELSQRAAQESLPLRDAFAVLFFVSVGMLFDPSILRAGPDSSAGSPCVIIVVGKSVAALRASCSLFRHPPRPRSRSSASLAQIGEFSFILAALGMELQLLPERGRDLIPSRRAHLHSRESHRVRGGGPAGHLAGGSGAADAPAGTAGASSAAAGAPSGAITSSWSASGGVGPVGGARAAGSAASPSW